MENKLRANGFAQVAGVDEVGRGPLAGPVVAAAVILPAQARIRGLCDSKLATAEKREELFRAISQKAIAIGIGEVGHKMIDKVNIRQANLLAMKLAVEGLATRPDHILIDGERDKIDLPIPQSGIKGGDRKCASIAAASIIAKVTRDRIMMQLHKKYSKYRFDLHKGYGTEKHLERLRKYGPCPVHRRSFAPVSQSSSRPKAGKAAPI
ncbi:ribonuclease HII [Candidatus Margulisiibacteriota bacterium]